MPNNKKEYFVDPNGLVSVPLPIPKIDHLSGDVKNHAGHILDQTVALDVTHLTITLNGPSTVNIVQGGTYIELGANWTDTIDGSGSVSSITGSVNTGVIGSSTIRYSKNDAAGNTSTICRTVNVIAPVDPMLIGPALQHITISDNDGVLPITPINVGGVIDPLGRAVTYSASGLPAGFSINPVTGVISGMHDAFGDEVFGITVNATPNEGSNSLVRSFTLNIVDQG